MPLTVPPDTVATDEGVLLHVPPVVVSVSTVVAPAHNVVTPLIAAGEAVTVSVLVTVHPVPSE